MCGIFGIAVDAPPGARAAAQVRQALGHLFRLSESRGREASGLAAAGPDGIGVLKSAGAAHALVRSRPYAELLDAALCGPGGAAGALLAGHSRLVTTGSQADPANNQPVAAEGVVGVHNGIVVNHEALWAAHPDLKRHGEVDSEALLALLGARAAQGDSPVAGARGAFAEIEGVASVACLFTDRDALLLASNNGSLFWMTGTADASVAFASERHILERLARTRAGRALWPAPTIRQVAPGTGCLLVPGAAPAPFPLAGEAPAPVPAAPARRRAVTVRALEAAGAGADRGGSADRRVGLTGAADAATAARVARLAERFPHTTEWQDSLRRCTRCILPETMPFIAFDADGVCSYCRSYRPLRFAGPEALEAAVAPHRARDRGDGSPDCVVGVSGGRDSLYSLHYAKRVLGLTPVAYTYEWGMVTDLARRNISRACARLGVEHVIVSADIRRKRRYIRDNVQAWLKAPDLGLIPLFMAGDKQYFHYLKTVARQVGAPLTLLGENMLERTDFKSGFAGVPPHNADPHHVYTLPLADRLRMAAYYARAFLANPGYLNASLLDTAWAYACYYLASPRYLNLFTYIPWDEDEVVGTLTRDYGFERAPDTASTWRIGDGTAAFYNYIYYTAAGFTENDTFRSNQIREGLIGREAALGLARQENRPRWETLDWYLSIIGLEDEVERVIERIHSMPRGAMPRGAMPRRGAAPPPRDR